MRHFGLIALLSLIPLLAWAGGKAAVTWESPENYKDVRASSGSEAEFRDRVFNQLENHLNELAAALPDGQTLEMTVTDLSLAGDLRLSGARTGHQDVRVVSDMYPARISFRYRLLDSSGKLLKEGSEKLRSSPLSSGTIRANRSEPLGMEKAMLTRWFKKNFQ